MDEIMELNCAVYGERSTFAVKVVRKEDVSRLQETIAAIVSKDRQAVPSRLVALYKARKRDGSWLKTDDSLADFLKRERQGDEEYVKLYPVWKLNDGLYFGPAFEPGRGEIHLLVELPEQKQPEPQQREMQVVDSDLKRAVDSRHSQ